MVCSWTSKKAGPGSSKYLIAYIASPQLTATLTPHTILLGVHPQSSRIRPQNNTTPWPTTHYNVWTLVDARVMYIVFVSELESVHMWACHVACECTRTWAHRIAPPAGRNRAATRFSEEWQSLDQLHVLAGVRDMVIHSLQRLQFACVVVLMDYLRIHLSLLKAY